ncbi:MAG: ribosome silencing factor [Thermoguttaceae bacterium]|nr:ribosome silencing factor [Thermoguttaceae bacterium]
MTNEKKLPNSLERARIAAKVIVDNKGDNVKILDLRALTQAFDYFVIGTAVSRRQSRGIGDEIDDVFQKELGDSRRCIEGYQESRWLVLDYGDVVVHLFEPETREFYGLEDLWGKAPDVPLEAPEGETVEAVQAPIVKTEEI